MSDAVGFRNNFLLIKYVYEAVVAQFCFYLSDNYFDGSHFERGVHFQLGHSSYYRIFFFTCPPEIVDKQSDKAATDLTDQHHFLESRYNN